MSVQELPNIPLKNNLLKHNNYNTLLNLIVKKVQDIPQFLQLKIGSNIEIELINLVCNIVENVIPNKNPLVIDKKQLVIDVFTLVFGISNEDKQALNNQIDYLYNNNKIKKLTYIKKISKSIYHYFRSKLP